MSRESDLQAAYEVLKKGSLWSSTGKCKGYAVANPGEAAKIDQYVADIVAGKNPAWPVLATLTGQGIVGMIDAGFRAAPAPSPHKKYAIRALYDIERRSYPLNFDEMNLSCIQTYQKPDGPSYQLVRGFDAVAAPDTGWTWMGGFAPSATGGMMKVTDTKLRDVFAAVGSLGYTVATHPRNSHVYILNDDDQMKPLSTGYSVDQIKANLSTIADFYDLLHNCDPLARCGVVEWSEHRIPWYADSFIGRRSCDFILLDGYSNNAPPVGYLEDRIPNQASWAEAAGKDYAFCLSVHDNNGQPTLPTPDIFDHEMDQVEATNAIAVWLYAWLVGTAPNISNSPELQAGVGQRMALVS